MYILREKQQRTGSGTHDLLPTSKSGFSFCHIDTFIFVPVSMRIDVRPCGKDILGEMNGTPSLFPDCLDDPQIAKIPECFLLCIQIISAFTSLRDYT